MHNCTASTNWFSVTLRQTDKQVPFATSSSIELYEEVHHGNQQKRNTEVALKNAENALVKEKAHVSALRTAIAKLESIIAKLVTNITV